MIEYNKKKLLILGGASQHCKVVEAAHSLGATVYVVDYLKNSPAKLIADKSYLIDIYDLDTLVKLCNEEKIDGVIATSLDACSIPYQRLCERMGYPCFGTREQYHVLTNKQIFKKFCIKYGVDIIPSYTEEDIWENNNIEYPLFIKPVDGSGSKGQSICSNREDTLLALKRAKEISKSGNVLIEKYMSGCQDFTVSYLVVNGEPILVRTGDRFEGPNGSGLENLCIASVSPSRYTDLYLNGAHKKVVSMIRGMKLENAPVFFQGFIDGEKIRLYDPGLRFAGGEYERLQAIATGKDIIKMLVEYALSGKASKSKIDDSITLLNGKTIIQLDPTLCAGKIADIQGMDSIKANSAIISISQRYEVGDVVPETNDIKQRFAEFAILSNSINEEIENVRFLQRNLKITNVHGKNMIVYAFDIENLMYY